MDVYVLDSLYRPIACVDEYESLVWTERFSDAGDFELKLSSTIGNRNLFTEGTRLIADGSLRVMTVETVQDSTSEDGATILTVSGPSLEAVMKDRVAYNFASDLTVHPTWDFIEAPGVIARVIMGVVLGGAIDVKDSLPLTSASTDSPGTNPESTSVINVSLTPASLYETIKNLVDLIELGFKFTTTWGYPGIYWDIYSGDDKTSRQTNFPAVVFGPDNDSIHSTTELTVIQDSKNVAYVYGPAGFVTVYGENVPNDIAGYERRVLMVDGGSVQVPEYRLPTYTGTPPSSATIAADNAAIAGALTQLGEAALRNARASILFDGEVNQHGMYRYGVDYKVGDLVEVRNKDNVVTYKRVTEHIFSSDENGVLSYPTLTADVFAGVNDWLAYDNDARTWQDLGGDFDAWSDLP